MREAMLLQLWQDKRSDFRALAYTIYPDAGALDDILQDTFIKVWRRLSREDHPEVYALCRRSIINTAIGYLRKSRTFDKTFSPLGAYDDTRARTLSPLQRLLRQERVSILLRARAKIRKLPPKNREALEVYYFRGSPRIKDYCAEHSVPYTTFRCRMLRGLELLRSDL